MSLKVRALVGPEIARSLPGLARLRISVFRAFPYLYDGDDAYEARYLAHFAAADGAVIVGAFDGEVLVGAATAAPLRAQAPEIRAPFAAAGIDPARYCYFGESVLEPAYRGTGLGVRFFAEREAHARAIGCTAATFCAVVRALDHPARPQDHVPLDAFWRRRGYAPVPGRTCTLAWREIGDTEEKAHTMQVWERALT